MDNIIDFTFRYEGSIYLLQPCNDGARAWVDDNLDPDHQTWGTAVVIEPRYVADVLQGIQDAGFKVDLCNLYFNFRKQS